jgi:outer membrane receptor for ferrienterochelin and colicins
MNISRSNWGAVKKMLLVAASVLVAPPIAAQSGDPLQEAAADLANMSIEELLDARVENVYGASRYKQRVTQAPASVTIVTADEIKKQGHRNLADVLRGARSFYVTYDRNYSNIGIRGFSRPGDFNTRVLLLVDGHRMNDHLYGSALLGTEANLDVDLIDRVEIIRGPSSSIYGNSAFFGVINVTTRKGAEIDGVEVSGEGGSFDTYKGRFTYGKLFKNEVDLVISGTLTDSAGQRRLYFSEFDDAENNHGIATNQDGEQSHHFLAKVSYRDFTFSGAYAERVKEIPTASFSTVFNDGREETTDRQYYLDLKYDKSFPDELQVMGRLFYDYYGYDGNYPYNFAAPGAPRFVVVTHDDNSGDGVGAEFQLRKEIFERHTLLFGSEYRRSLSLYQSNFTDDPKTYSSRIEEDGWTAGLYVQGEFKLMENLLLNAGLRYDEFNNFGGTVNPRAGLIYNPWEKTTFKALYGQAYRAPNAYELYQASTFYSKANPSLEPETIRTFELIYEQYLPLDHRASVSGFYYDVEELINQELDPADGLRVFRNVAAARAKGLEFELEGKYEHGIRARASYTVQRTEESSTGMELSNSPRHMGKLGVIAPVFSDKFFAGIELQYLSPMKTLGGNRTSGFLLANLTLFSRELVKNLELSATVYNLFDKNYAYPGGTAHVQDAIPQDGRSFRTKLTYKF